jgi:hypothetical protein
VGDMEGQLWELDARTGVNVNVSRNTQLSGCTNAAPCEFPAFDMGSTDAVNQPISTNISVAKIPSNIATGKALSAYPNATVLLVGTAGEDWVSTPGSDPGKLHVLLYDQQRVPVFAVGGTQIDGSTAWTASTVKSVAASTGVLQEPTAFPAVMANGERLYGNITVAGQVAYFETANGPVGDIMKLQANVSGHTYGIDLGAATSGSLSTTLPGNYATFGGLAVYTSGGTVSGVIGSEVGKVNYVKNSSLGALATPSAPNSALSPNKGDWTFRLRNWLSRFLK